MIRTFVALEIPREIIDFSFQKIEEKINALNNFKWEPKSKLHLTLKFIGNIEETNVEKIINDLETHLKQVSSLNLSLDKFGFFIKENKPKIFWLGLKENDKLSKLASEIDEIISKYGIEKEKRKFKPHITYLRVKGNEDLTQLTKLKEIFLEEKNFTANKIHLFKSDLLKTGSVYTSLKEFQLK